MKYIITEKMMNKLRKICDDYYDAPYVSGADDAVFDTEYIETLTEEYGRITDELGNLIDDIEATSKEE